MPLSSDLPVLFVSSNRHKYEEAKSVLDLCGIGSEHAESELLEIQSDSLADVAEAKAQSAFSRFQRPVLVEDDGLFIDALGGFPGVYSSYVYRTIGLDGVLRLLGNRKCRRASFTAVVSYHDGGSDCLAFEGSISGTISTRVTGEGWGYDPVFVPDGSKVSFAQMGRDGKTGISHRSMALQSFARWYGQNRA